MVKIGADALPETIYVRTEIGEEPNYDLHAERSAEELTENIATGHIQEIGVYRLVEKRKVLKQVKTIDSMKV